MACMEHECHSCGRVWFDNQARPACTCGSTNVSHWFDEEPDHSDFYPGDDD